MISKTLSSWTISQFRACSTFRLPAPQPTRNFALLYRPKIQINFGKENKYHIYHSEGGERFLANCTRLNMLFIAGNSILLLLEVVSPCNALSLTNLKSSGTGTECLSQ